ncbi:MAG: Spy/CpxP family protein refolding chaperone [Rubrivivax sp.]|nr:Spy/CpxP family protein refolding chaperone [Rubrivivax sp.]
MKTTTRIAAVSLAVLTLGLAGAVAAHPGMGMGMGQGMGPGMGQGMHGGMRGGMRGGMGGPQTPAEFAARLSDLKTELKITEAQEGAWQAFTAVSLQQVEQRQAMRAQMQAQMQDATPAERSAHYEAMKTVREAQFAARSKALADLHAVLTPEQKAVADQQLRGPHGQRMTMRGATR